MNYSIYPTPDFKKFFKKLAKKHSSLKADLQELLKLLVFGFLVLGLLQCESDDRFYRPRMPQTLSALAIIDADDTSRFILFEKAFQVEYPEDLNDSLRDISFTLSDSKGVIHSYHSDKAQENPFTYFIPDNIEFITGETYLFWAKERACQEITSEVTVPEPPSGLNLLSFEGEFVTIYEKECTQLRWNSITYLDVMTISFDNYLPGNSYYGILIESYGAIPIPAIRYANGEALPFLNSYINFSIRESAAPGFFSTFPGLDCYSTNPCDDYSLTKNPTPIHYIDGSKIPGNSLKLVITNLANDGISAPAYVETYRIRLLSITEEMYMFKKNLYTYKRNLHDPFSEPVYIKGNMKNGHGLFAICRSSEINMERRRFLDKDDFQPW